MKYIPIILVFPEKNLGAYRRRNRTTFLNTWYSVELTSQSFTLLTYRYILFFADVNVSYFYSDIDAAFSDYTKFHIYLFKGSHYLKINAFTGKPVDGAPTRISKTWHGLPDQWDAANSIPARAMLPGSVRGRWLFQHWVIYKSNKFWVLQSLTPNTTASPSTPLKRVEAFSNTDLDAAFQWPVKPFVSNSSQVFRCIFKETRYGLLDQRLNTSQSISADWNGIPSTVDAAVSMPILQSTYIFSGSLYWKVNMSNKGSYEGYPKPISTLLNGGIQSEFICVQFFEKHSSLFFMSFLG